MKKFIIQDREAGNFIKDFSSLQIAEMKLKLYEIENKENGCYSKNFYEIKEIKI